MAIVDGDGKYVATDGSKWDRPEDADAKSGGGGGGGGGGMAGGFLLIFIFGPIIAAKIVGWLWGMLLKLGIVGKIVTSALMVFAGLFIVVVPLAFAGDLFQSLFKSMGIGIAVQMALFIYAPAFLLPVWYYFWHYDVVKEMGASEFSKKIGNFAMFVWFGFIASVVISFFKGYGKETAAIISLVSSVAGVVYYFWSTREYARDVERTMSFKFRWIGLAVGVGLVVLFGVATQVERAENEARTAANEAGIVTATSAKGKKQKQRAAEYASGTVLFVNGNYKVKLYEEANELSKVVMELNNKGGEKLISNGEPLFNRGWDNGFVPVTYNGVNAWVSTTYTDPIRGIATVVSDKTEFSPKNTYDANDNSIYHQSITLKKGDTFEVLDVNEKHKFVYAIYNGQVGRVNSSDITVAKGQ